MRAPLFIAITSCLTSACTGQSGPDTVNTGVAVVELFGSEGCSSCPPADDLALALHERAQVDGAAVFVLSFPVPYWDRLGWKDRFARPAWEQRQRGYVEAARNGLYTPQVVVNGTTSFVGSDRMKLHDVVEHALAEPSTVRIVLSIERTTIGAQVDYALHGDLDGTTLQVCLVEDGLGSHVETGENAGKHLEHPPIVREMRTMPIQKSGDTGKVVLDITSLDDPDHARVVAFVQQGDQGMVVGATAVPLPAD